MKVPKSISFDAKFLEWIKENRPAYWKKFSQNVENAVRNEVMDSATSARVYERTRIAKRLAEINASLQQLTMEKEGLLLQMKFFEKKGGKKS